MIEIDKEKINQIGKDIGQSVNYFELKFKNDMWLSSLGKSERAMISDVKHEFMLNQFGGNEELLKKTSKLYSDYLNLIRAYNQISSLDLSTRMEAYNLGYNLGLSLEEACQVYLKCSETEAEEMYNKYHKLESMFQEYLSGIRKNYRSSLGDLLGISEQKYQVALPEISGTFDPDVANAHSVDKMVDEIDKITDTFDPDASKAYSDALDEFIKRFPRPSNSDAKIVDESIKSSFGK